MAYLGLVPSEHSSGATKSRGGITKTGNGHVRRVLVEAAWTCRHPARKTAHLQRCAERAPEEIQEIAWNAQLGNFQIDLASPRFIGPVAVAVAAVDAFLAALAVGGLAQRFNVHFHQSLQRVLQRLANKICVSPLFGELR